MAEETSTSRREAGETRTQTAVSLDDTEESVDTGASAAEDATALLEQLRQENENLKQQNERHRQQITGWETQSRRNLEERNAIAERLARLEGRVEATAQDRTRAQDVIDQADPAILAELHDGLNAWAKDDTTGLSRVVNAVKRLVPASQPTLDEASVAKVVQRQLADFGQKASMQSVIARRHPEMESAQHPLYQAAWDAYDDYAQDPDTVALYGNDDTRLVPFPSAKGTKMVHVGVLNALITDLKREGGFQEGRRAENRDASRGAVTTGNGRTTTGRRTVEAIELLTPDELSGLQDPRVRRGWGADLPTDLKAAAKYLYDGFTPDEKAKRLAEYRKQQGARA